MINKLIVLWKKHAKGRKESNLVPNQNPQRVYSLSVTHTPIKNKMNIVSFDKIWLFYINIFSSPLIHCFVKKIPFGGISNDGGNRHQKGI